MDDDIVVSHHFNGIEHNAVQKQWSLYMYTLDTCVVPVKLPLGPNVGKYWNNKILHS